jgi:TRAP-type transport system small permease protein
MRGFVDRLDRLVRGAVFLLFIALVALVALQVGLRYLLGTSIHWEEEAARYLMIWITFLTSGVGLRVGAHVAVDFVKDSAPRTLRIPLLMLIKLGILLFLGIVASYGTWVTLSVRNQISPALEISMAIPYAAVPIGSSLMVIYTLELLWKDIRALAMKE